LFKSQKNAKNICGKELLARHFFLCLFIFADFISEMDNQPDSDKLKK
jgi:hypothetical protein